MTALKNVTRAFSETRLGVGLLLGFFLLLAVYFAVSPQFGANNPGDLVAFSQAPPSPEANSSAPLRDTPEKDEDDDKKEKDEAELPKNDEATDSELGGGETTNPEPAPPMKPICDFSDWRYDGCEMFGDARALGMNSTVFYVPSPAQMPTAEAHNWSIRSQSRKIVGVKEVTVKSLNASQAAPACTVNHSVPALVFALGGLTFNYWHAFSDVLVPLFITARSFDGEIQFLVRDYVVWFIEKYRNVFTALSRYELINFDTDPEVRCYPHLIVSLRGHTELGIDPKRAPNNYDMFQFRMFLRSAYGLPLWVDLPYRVDDRPDKKPRLMLILRSGSRKLLNAEEVIGAVEAAGFEVVKAEPQFSVNMTEFSRVVDSCDVLMGAHGAGLTNVVFLRTNAVLVQIVPYGHMEWAAELFLGGPAKEMKLRHLNYSITAEESSLMDKYGKDDPVIADPELINKEGKGGTIYWSEQDIKLNVTRFAPVLEKAHQFVISE